MSILVSKYEFERTVCQECSEEKQFDYLSMHIRQKHKDIGVSFYKEKYGIDIGLGLMSEEVRLKKSIATKENGTIKNLSSVGSISNRFSGGHQRYYKRRPMTVNRLIYDNNFIRLKKLTYEQVQTIKSKLNTERAKDLAIEYNVSVATISNIKLGKRRTML